MPEPLSIVICGSQGRMGRRIAALAETNPRFTIVARIDIANSSELKSALARAEAVIDFSTPRASVAAAAAAAGFRVPIVIGTTGFVPAQLKRLRSIARRTALLIAPNMSPGMNLLFELARIAAAALKNYDAAISETHHTRKKDAPSGSAKRLAESIREARGGNTSVPAVSLRAGDVIGDHTVLLAGPNERLELTHRAHSRDVFARGALDAALWIAGRRSGLYSMRDVLKR